MSLEKSTHTPLFFFFFFFFLQEISDHHSDNPVLPGQFLLTLRLASLCHQLRQPRHRPPPQVARLPQSQAFRDQQILTKKKKKKRKKPVQPTSILDFGKKTLTPSPFPRLGLSETPIQTLAGRTRFFLIVTYATELTKLAEKKKEIVISIILECDSLFKIKQTAITKSVPPFL